MSELFPPLDLAAHEWINVADRSGLNRERLRELLDRWISDETLLVEVHRKLGDLLPRQDAVAFIAAHLGEGQIRITDRDFRSFVVVASNGVAAGWRQSAHTSPGGQLKP